MGTGVLAQGLFARDLPGEGMSDGGAAALSGDRSAGLGSGSLPQVLAELSDQLAAVSVVAFGSSDADVVAALDVAHVLEQRLAAVKLDLVRAVDVRDVARRHGAASTTSWLAGRFRLDRSVAARLVDLAMFAYLHPAVRDGLRDGSVHVEQASRICRAVKGLPGTASASADQVQGLAVLSLLGHAAAHCPQTLAMLGGRILAAVAPDAAERAELEALERSVADAKARRSFTLTPMSVGGVKVSGYLTDEAAASVRAAIDAIIAPRAEARARRSGDSSNGAGGDGAAGDSAHGDSAGGGSAAGGEVGGGEPAAAGGSGAVLDERSPGQRRADALEEVCKLALRTEELPAHGGERPHLNVTVSYDVLVGELAAGTLDTGEVLPAETVRRLACDAKIIPVVLDGAGQVLDLGRTRRLVSGALRTALNLRDGGCVFPHCDRPPTWCEAHHTVSWAGGGPTSLDNSTLLCGHHHRVVHQGEWKVRHAADGLPEFIPPPWVDAEQRPQRHHRYTQRAITAARRSMGGGER